MIREIFLNFLLCQREIAAANVCQEVGNIQVQKEERIFVQLRVKIRKESPILYRKIIVKTNVYGCRDRLTELTF